MCKYDDITHDPIHPMLTSGKKEHVLVAQDKCIVNVNKGPWCGWLNGDQQPLKKREWACNPHLWLDLQDHGTLEAF